MSDLDYLLVVLTHGDGETLEGTLDSYGERVRPFPAQTCIVRDGPGYSYLPNWVSSPWSCQQVDAAQVGFCRATGYAWEVAARSACPFVFYLEHDFEFLADVDLRQLADVLDAEPTLAQMGLMREPVNEREVAAGGLYALNRDRYWPRDGWLLSRTNFSTTCSLMRRAFMAERPWPSVDRVAAECEGVYSIELLEAGYEFAVWGDGSPQVRHTGVRTGWGY